LRGTPYTVEFRVVDITRPRDPALLRKTRGTTAPPVLDTAEVGILKESLVILRYHVEMLPGALLRRADPFEHAVESMLVAWEGPFTTAGYLYVLNQDPNQRAAHCDKLLGLHRDMTGFLCAHSAEGQ
jgi:glutathione S-transferase